MMPVLRRTAAGCLKEKSKNQTNRAAKTKKQNRIKAKPRQQMSLFFFGLLFFGFGQAWASIFCFLALDRHGFLFLFFVLNLLPQGTHQFLETESRFCQINVFICCSEVDMFMIWSKKFLNHVFTLFFAWFCGSKMID